MKQSMIADHRVDWGQFGWSCSCGKENEWPLAPAGRGRAAANNHLRAIRRNERVNRPNYLELERTERRINPDLEALLDS